MVEKVEKSKCNNKAISNKVDRNFGQTIIKSVCKWLNICKSRKQLELHLLNNRLTQSRNNRIFSRKNKKVDLVKEAIYSIKYILNKIKIFHTDRGWEFYNKSVDKSLDILWIERSLSEKGSSYDNAFKKLMKTEFVYQNEFK